MIRRRPTLFQRQRARWQVQRQAQWNRQYAPISLIDPSTVYVPNPESQGQGFSARPRMLLRNQHRREVLF